MLARPMLVLRTSLGSDADDKSVESEKRPPVGVDRGLPCHESELRKEREVPANVPSTSLDHGSKLRGPIVHHWPLLSPIFRAAYESCVVKPGYLLKRSTNRSKFLLLHMTGSAGQPGRVSLIETSDNPREQALENTVGGVGLPISAFPSVLKWLVASLPMMPTIHVAFDTSLNKVMPPILHLRKPTVFHHHGGLRLQNHRS
ncbi:uncharacterized protein TNCV_415001 [Trichonephila clavipes]|nr:uncharacterized protein TNCV_415001 [Trichonephila clavipes]